MSAVWSRRGGASAQPARTHHHAPLARSKVQCRPTPLTWFVDGVVARRPALYHRHIARACRLAQPLVLPEHLRALGGEGGLTLARHLGCHGHRLLRDLSRRKLLPCGLPRLRHPPRDGGGVCESTPALQAFRHTAALHGCAAAAPAADATPLIRAVEMQPVVAGCCCRRYCCCFCSVSVLQRISARVEQVPPPRASLSPSLSLSL